MSAVTPHPVHGDIIHFFDGDSPDPKVRTAIVLATVVSEIPETYDVIYLPRMGELAVHMFTARNSETFPLVGHISREGMQLLLDPRQWS